MIEAEEAFKIEVAEMANAEADPFTRRACRPTIQTGKVSTFYSSVKSIKKQL